LSRGAISGCAAIIIIILFLYCFPVASNNFDNFAVKGTADHFVIPASGQEEEQLSLPQLNDQALRIEPVVEGGLLSQLAWSS
jgi:hypothetical protein